MPSCRPTIFPGPTSEWASQPGSDLIRMPLLDVQLAQWFHSHAAPPLTRAMLPVSDLNDVLAWHRARSWLLILALTVPGGMLINVLMKLAFHRARPSFDDPLATGP